MAKEQINQYIKEIKETSYLEDMDENNNSFKRVCIFFDDDDGNPIEMHLNKNDSAALITQEGKNFFVDTDKVDARIEAEKEFINNIKSIQ